MIYYILIRIYSIKNYFCRCKIYLPLSNYLIMKKILSLLVLLVALVSCEEDVKFNTPAVQGLRDNDLWKATEYSATRGLDNSLTIRATNGFENITLITGSVNPGSYELGINEINRASYIVSVEGTETVYTTGTFRGNGIITVSDDPRDTDLTRGYITGTFYFNAEDDQGNEVNFQEGVFYKVPVTTILN